MATKICFKILRGADVRDRTGDLVITNDVLYQLSYIGLLIFSIFPTARPAGFEPVTSPVTGERSNQLSYVRIAKPEIVTNLSVLESPLGRRVLYFLYERKERRITEIESAMSDANFGMTKKKPKPFSKNMPRSSTKLPRAAKFERGNAIITIFSGAGGDDAEDFSRMLLKCT